MSTLWLVATYAAGIGTGVLLLRMGLEMEIRLAQRAALEASDAEAMAD